MQVWHVVADDDEDFAEEVEQSGGYIVRANTEKDAIQLVEAREEEQRLTYLAAYGGGPKDDSEAHRRWYHVGVSKKKWPIHWVVRPVTERVYRIPFLGYSW